jgi:hypothetical protein
MKRPLRSSSPRPLSQGKVRLAKSLVFLGLSLGLGLGLGFAESVTSVVYALSGFSESRL